MNCPKCATQLSPDARFCGNCGLTLQQTPPPPPVAPTPPPPPQQQYQQPPTPPPNYQQQQQSQPQGAFHFDSDGRGQGRGYT